MQYEQFMEEECLAQHQHHQGQIAAMDDMWTKRMDAVIEERKAREWDLKTEIERLKAKMKDERKERGDEVRRMVQAIKDFACSHQFNGYTSVPLLLQHLEQLSHGTVDQATERPIGSTQPTPLNTSASSYHKRSRDSETPKMTRVPRPAATKRHYDPSEDCVMDPPTARVRVE